MSEAIPEPTELDPEYAVQYRAYIGGKFERTIPYDSLAKAEAQVAAFNRGKAKGLHARVAVRYVTKWRTAT